MSVSFHDSGYLGLKATRSRKCILNLEEHVVDYTQHLYDSLGQPVECYTIVASSSRPLPLEQTSLHTHNFYCRGIDFAIAHTHQLHNFNCRGIDLCNACVSLVSVCLASIISQKENYTAIMLGELISNYTHTSHTTIVVRELIV